MKRWLLGAVALLSACALSPQEISIVSNDVAIGFTIVEAITPALILTGAPPAVISLVELAEKAASSGLQAYLNGKTPAAQAAAALKVASAATQAYSLLPAASSDVVSNLVSLQNQAVAAMTAWNQHPAPELQAVALSRVAAFAAGVAAQDMPVKANVTAIRRMAMMRNK